MANAGAARGSAWSVRGLAGWVFLGAASGALLLVALVVLALGSGYYLTPVDQRIDHPQHLVFGSGGVVGLLLGVVGTALMVLVLLYSVRKWLPFLSFLGSSQFWMRFHLVAGLLGPLFILLHGSLKLPSGFIGIGFWCMVAVATSGFFGRYLFGYLPATAEGLRLDLQTEQQKLSDLKARIVAETREAASDRVAEAVRLARDLHLEPTTLAELVVLDAEVRRRADLIRVHLHRAQLPPAARKRAETALVAQLTLRRNLAGFDVARRLLRYWNLLHQPLALAMYLISVVHILNALVFGGALRTLFGVGG